MLSFSPRALITRMWARVLRPVIELADCALLRALRVGWMLDWMLSLLATVAMLCRGSMVAPGATQSSRPRKPLKLYEYEASPFSRKVRVALTELDLDCSIYPCPRETMLQNGYASKESRFRRETQRLGGRIMFPFFVDENQGVTMYQSEEIVKYLWTMYGDKAQKPLLQRLLPTRLQNLLCALPTVIRPLGPMGVMRTPSVAPRSPLELYSFEASPSCRIVRERLSSLELPYMLHNVAPGSAKVAAMQSFAGRAHVPYLVDANTGFRSFSTGDILKYLDTTYMRAPSLAESAPQQGGKQARR